MPRLSDVLTSKIALCAISGLILGLSFPPFHFSWLAFVGFVPFLITIEKAENYRDAFKLSYVAFLVLNVVVIYWIGGWSRESDPFMMIGGVALMLGHPLFFTVPILFYHFLRKRLGRSTIFIFPFIYLSFEHLHSISEVAFPWLTVGYSQSYNLADIQFAQFTGLFGISFQVLLANTFFAIAVKSFTTMSDSRWMKVACCTIAGLLLIIIPEIYGLNVLRHADTSNASHIKVAVVQPNIDPYAKWSGSPTQILRTYEGETRKILKSKPDLVVWPETAIPFYILLPQLTYFRNELESFIDSNDVCLLSGVPLAYYFSAADSAKPSSHYDSIERKYYDAYNGAALFEPHSGNFQTYGKIILVPFGERIPYADAVPYLIKPLEWGVGISNWARGLDTTIFKLPDGNQFGTVICYESIFPDYVRQFVKRGANFIVIITNDGWFGKSSGPPQHAAYASIRAVENRRAIVRSANTGISEMIDEYGRFIGKPTGLDISATLVADVPLARRLTFYTRHGDVIAQIAEGVTLVSILIALFLKFKYKEKES
ncbi:MAG TPA: apolipoprotein N-acyltransferase [Candidatus Kryptonia bacterium]